MVNADLTQFMGLDFFVNAATILVSIIALIYWVRLFKRIHLEERDEGWLWIFSSVLMVLLLNLSTLVLVILSGRLPLGGQKVFIVDPITYDFVSTFSRLVMALAISVGTYMLFRSMSITGDVKFAFSPLMLEPETESEVAKRFELVPGISYLIKEGIPAGAGREYYMHKDRWVAKGMDLFVDLATHSVPGLLITRNYPPKLREEYGLIRTPMFWLTKEKDHKESVHPADLTELSHMIKSFVQKGGETVVLLEGIEYLITHNSFDEILRLVEGLHDVVARMNSILIVTIDPSTLTDQQYHLLSRALTEFKVEP